MNSFTRAVFLDFLTNPQLYNLRGSKTKDDFIGHMIDYLESTELYSVFWDEDTESIFMTQLNDFTKPVLKIAFKEEQTFLIQTVTDTIDLEDKDELKIIGNAALHLMNAHTEWESSAGLPSDDETYEKIQIFLSESEVELTEEEKTTIYGILERMSKSNNFIYDRIENKSFEIELRGIYYDGTPRLNEMQTEDDSNDDDLEWI